MRDKDSIMKLEKNGLAVQIRLQAVMGGVSVPQLTKSKNMQRKKWTVRAKTLINTRSCRAEVQV